jgi:hypothetical protein
MRGHFQHDLFRPRRHRKAVTDIRSVRCSRAEQAATDSGNRDAALAAGTAEGCSRPAPADRLPRIGQDNEGIVMGFNKVSTLLAAAMAISTPVAAQAACDPAAGLTFICGLTNAEDLVQVPGTPWIVASGLAEGEHTEGHIYLVNAHDRTVQVLLPGHVVYQQDTETFGACPGAPDETKFSAHGLSLRVGSASEHTLYVVHHGERESVEAFKLKAGAVAPTLTWVGCVVYPAGVLGNGVAALPGDAFAASNFLSTNDPKAFDKLMAGEPEGGMLIWRPSHTPFGVEPSAPSVAVRRCANPGSWRQICSSAPSNTVR